jgi:hypothetical protein
MLYAFRRFSGFLSVSSYHVQSSAYNVFGLGHALIPSELLAAERGLNRRYKQTKEALKVLNPLLHISLSNYNEIN